jgi:hypothetical protein
MIGLLILARELVRGGEASRLQMPAQPRRSAACRNDFPVGIREMNFAAGEKVRDRRAPSPAGEACALPGTTVELPLKSVWDR